jgi:hypothetical protein
VGDPRRADAKLVFADNLYAYGPPDCPMTEETPERAEGRRGRTRVEMARAVLRVHADGAAAVHDRSRLRLLRPRGTATTAGDNIMHQFERPFVPDASKLRGAFGPFGTTPHREAVRRTVAWFRGRYAA